MQSALYRLLPWDHAPGALILREAGGVARHPDGRDYDVFDKREPTLLSPDEGTWQRTRAELFTGGRRASTSNMR
ncbi:MAG: inositol monophosphatase family protein [Polyangiaceae bacterium]